MAPPPRVLVALRMPRDRERARGVLEAAGARVDEAPNGRVAVDKLGPEVDVVVASLVMPLLAGADLTREILGRAPAVKVIVVDSAQHAALAESALQAGARAFVPTPWEDADLRNAVFAAVGEQAPTTQAGAPSWAPAAPAPIAMHPVRFTVPVVIERASPLNDTERAKLQGLVLATEIAKTQREIAASGGSIVLARHGAGFVAEISFELPSPATPEVGRELLALAARHWRVLAGNGLDEPVLDALRAKVHLALE